MEMGGKCQTTASCGSRDKACLCLANHTAEYGNRLQLEGLQRRTALLRSPRYTPGISVLAKSNFFCVCVRALFVYFSPPRI